MKQRARHSVVYTGGGILGVCSSLAAEAASLGPSPPAGWASGAAWAATANGPALPAAAILLAWAPLLLLVALGTILAVLIRLQPATPGERSRRRKAGKRRLALAAAGPAATVESWRGAMSTPQPPRR